MIVSGSSVDRNSPVSAAGRDARSRLVVDRGEDAAQARFRLLFAAFDPQRHPLAEVVELADLDRRAERARAQVEPQPFVAVARIGLDPADDGDVEQQQRDGEHVGHAQQPAIADADPAQRVEFGRQGELAEGEQDAEHQPDRDAEREIFGQQIGEHPPHHADRPAGVDDEVEQPQHLFEHQQHRGEHQRAEQRNGDVSREVAVDQCERVPPFRRPCTMIWPQSEPESKRVLDDPACKGGGAAVSAPVAEWTWNFMRNLASPLPRSPER